MWPPPQVGLNLDFCLLLLLTGDASLNLGPACAASVWQLSINAVSCGIMHQLYVTSKGIDLLGITETWLTPRETSVDVAEMTPPPRVSPLRKPEHRGEGEEWACSFLQPINLQRSVCWSKEVLSLYLVNLNVVGHVLLSSTFIIHLALLIHSSVTYKIYCPTYPHSLKIWCWMWWGTSTFILIPHHPMLRQLFWSPSICWLPYLHSQSFSQS